MTVYLMFWVVCAIGAYLIADSRQLDNPIKYGLVGFLLGPVGVGWALLASSSEDDEDWR